MKFSALLLPAFFIQISAQAAPLTFQPQPEAIPARSGSTSQTCTQIDLRKTYPSELGPGTIRNQELFPLCPAFSASDLLGPLFGKEVSSLSVAMTATEERVRSHAFREPKSLADFYLSIDFSIEGGLDNVGVYTSVMDSNDLCAEKDMPFRDGFVFLPFVNEDVASILREVEAAGQDLRGVTSLEQQRDDVRKVQSLFRRLEFTDIVSAAVSSKTGYQFMQLLRKTNCKGSLPELSGTFPLYQPAPLKASEGVLGFVHSALEQGKLVGFVLSPEYLMDVPGLELVTDSHVVSIVGRRWNLGRCELLVRNSYGPRAQCLSTNEDPDNCTGGYFWENESEIAEKGFSFLHL